MNPQNPDSFSPQNSSGNHPVAPNLMPAQPGSNASPEPPEGSQPAFGITPPNSAVPPSPEMQAPQQPATFSPQNSPSNTGSLPGQPQVPTPHVAGVFGVSQPPAPGVPGQSSPNDYYANGAKPGNKLGILSLVLAVLFAPAGLVLGIVSMINGFKRNNKNLAFMGLGAVILSPIMMVVGIVVYHQLNNTALAVGTLKEQKLVIGRNTIIAKIPDKFKKSESTAENQQIYSIKGTDREGKETAAAQFAASIIEDAYTTDDLAIIKSALANPSSQEGKIFVSIVKQSLTDELKQIGCGDTIMDNPQSYTVEGAEYAAKFPFHCDIGGEGQYKGYMIDAGTKTDESIILVAAAEEMWTKNVEKFEKTVASIKLETN